MAADASSRFFFVHVMRTGGTTLEQQLRRAFPKHEVYPNPDLDFPEGDILHHLEVSYLLGLPQERLDQIRLFYGHFPYLVTEMLGIDLVTFTLLRDPVERTISLLRIMREREGWHDRTLEEMYDDPNMFPRLIANHQTKIYAITEEDRPQSYRDEIPMDAARLEIAKRNLARVDLIGFTEQYGAFIATLRSRFGWQLSEQARMNAASGSPEDSKELRYRIAADNAIDVEFYEYARGLVAARD
jgi:hypothetical protein